MGRPSKSTSVLEQEKRSHRTKAELESRKNAEVAVLTGKRLTEQADVKRNPLAHKEFQRVSKLMTAIGKNDALYSATINRYCKLRSECSALEEDIRRTREVLAELDATDCDMDFTARNRMKIKLNEGIIGADKQIQSKRKMMFDIEKEFAMTVASAARSIPKKAPEKKNPLMEVLGGGN